MAARVAAGKMTQEAMDKKIQDKADKKKANKIKSRQKWVDSELKKVAEGKKTQQWFDMVIEDKGITLDADGKTVIAVQESETKWNPVLSS